MKTPTGIPKHEWLRKRLEAEIRRLRLKAGDPFHSERELIKSYGLSLPTVRRALGDLMESGILQREQGRGTFVAPLAKRRILLVTGSHSMATTRHPYLHSQVLGRLMEDPSVTRSEWMPQYVPARFLLEIGEEITWTYKGLGALVVLQDAALCESFRAVAEKAGVPLLFLGSSMHRARLTDVPSVTWSEETVVDAAVRALVEAGRKRTLFVHEEGREVEIHRSEIFARLAGERGLDFASVSWKIDGPLPEIDASFDSVFGATDPIACRMIQHLRGRSVDVPGKVAVIGVNNYPLGLYTQPALTTVDRRIDLAALSLFEVAVAAADGESPASRLLENAELVRRESL